MEGLLMSTVEHMVRAAVALALAGPAAPLAYSQSQSQEFARLDVISKDVVYPD